MLSEYGGGLRIEHYTPLLMSLGVLLVQLPVIAYVHRATNGKHLVVEVYMRPAKPAHFAAAHSCGHFDPHERAPVGVQGPRACHEPSSLFRAWRLRVGVRHRWLVCLLGNVGRDP